MSEFALRVEGISKRYRINHQTNSLAQRLQNLFSSPKEVQQAQDFWALQDVTFELKKGEVLGIIGKNGAGKSTLLKILSRITPPTKGEITIEGRINALLEVGTGFHPDLTGRENIFLNGGILGMPKAEIKRRLDEIVDFAKIGQFLDTAVKYYSTGMYMRLAFAISAHLDSDILLADEVLSVGDAKFQQKCLGKMQEISGEGKTVIFVSHHLESLNRICPQSILLNQGKIKSIGKTQEIIHQYLEKHTQSNAQHTWEDLVNAPGNHIARLTQVTIHDQNFNPKDQLDVTSSVGISIDYQVLKEGHTFTHGCNLYNEDDVNILNSHDIVSSLRLLPRKKGKYRATMWIPSNLLNEGIVKVGVALFEVSPFQLYCQETHVVAFQITDPIQGKSARGDYTGDFPGIVRPLLQWEASNTDTL
ncbi:MAG TPA: ABC transporter ATP-binding protein [Microscillaceae bacterium]|nr:ABC transporter ATP-binding protein [Microscillaceae bacterium]